MEGGGILVSDAEAEAGMYLNIWTIEIGFEWEWEVEWHWKESMLEFKHFKLRAWRQQAQVLTFSDSSEWSKSSDWLNVWRCL
jgi:hypothetical protein